MAFEKSPQLKMEDRIEEVGKYERHELGRVVPSPDEAITITMMDSNTKKLVMFKSVKPEEIERDTDDWYWDLTQEAAKILVANDYKPEDIVEYEENVCAGIAEIDEGLVNND